MGWMSEIGEEIGAEQERQKWMIAINRAIEQIGSTNFEAYAATQLIIQIRNEMLAKEKKSHD